MHYLELLLNLIRNPGDLIKWGGYPVMAMIIFAETGLMAFFLPGDSLLVVAGIFAAKGSLNILWLNLLLIPLAVAGDALSYQIGEKTGPRIFSRPRSRFFNPDHLRAAHAFYAKHGGKTIIIARFIPVLRTFVPVVAGVAAMTYRRFAAYNIVGAASWVLSMTLLGYFLGAVCERMGLPLDRHIEKVIMVVVFLSILPGIIHYLRMRGQSKEQVGADGI